MEDKKEINLGDFKIKEKVLEVIAALAVLETEGVSNLKGGVTSAIGTLLRKKTSQGVKVSLEDKGISVDVHLGVNYGEVIPEVAKAVQKNVKNALESMVKFKVNKVNVYVDEVAVKEE